MNTHCRIDTKSDAWKTILKDIFSFHEVTLVEDHEGNLIVERESMLDLSMESGMRWDIPETDAITARRHALVQRAYDVTVAQNPSIILKTGLPLWEQLYQESDEALLAMLSDEDQAKYGSKDD